MRTLICRVLLEKRTGFAHLLTSQLRTADLLQSTPVVDERQQKQQSRIHHGAASGEVTRVEAAKLRSEQRGIKRAKKRAKVDGKVSRKERVGLHRKKKPGKPQDRKTKTRSPGQAVAEIFKIWFPLCQLRNCQICQVVLTSACSRSAMRSSASSTPMLKRMSESTRPLFIRSACGMLACVMEAG